MRSVEAVVRPILYGDARTARSVLFLLYLFSMKILISWVSNFAHQREHSANIIASPAAYEQGEPPKTQKVLQFDCRGLEFLEFKPEVSNQIFPLIKPLYYTNILFFPRENGW